MLQSALPLAAEPEVVDTDGATDADLSARAAQGEIDAFEGLYRRHVQSAWRVAQAVTGNADDAADAASDAFIRVFQSLRLGRLQDGSVFRSYLLATARNAAVDVLRRKGRLRPADTADHLDATAAGAGPAEAMLDGVDSSLVASAFRSLPERWRSVLWLTEVEGIPAREAAGLLGVSPNGVAQLAVRARAGLRERFLQAHLRRHSVERHCRHAVDRLGAYVAGGLAPREVAKVDQHLAGCVPCRGRVAELEDLGSTLRRVALPLPVGMAALGVKWRLAASAAEAAPAGAGGAPAMGASSLLAVPKPLALATAALLAAGAVGVGVGARLPGSGQGDVAVSSARTAGSPAPALAPSPAVPADPRAGAPAATPEPGAASPADACPAGLPPVEDTVDDVAGVTGAALAPPDAAEPLPGVSPPASDEVLGAPAGADVSGSISAPLEPAAAVPPTGDADPGQALGSTTAAVGTDTGARACVTAPLPGPAPACVLPDAVSATNSTGAGQLLPRTEGNGPRTAPAGPACGQGLQSPLNR